MSDSRSTRRRSGGSVVSRRRLISRRVIGEASNRRRSIIRTATPATPVGDALESLNIDPRLHRGIKVFKICTNGKIVDRVLSLSSSKFIIFCTPRKLHNTQQNNASNRFKASRQRFRARQNEGVDHHHIQRHIDISDISDVQTGFVGTRKLELSRSKYLGKRQFMSRTSLTRSWKRVTQQAASLIPDGSAIVSIIHGATRETLDLLIPNETERDLFVKALASIREVYSDVKDSSICEELLLRYAWYECDLSRNGRLHRKELKKVLKRLNIGYKGNLKKDYRSFIQSQNPNSRWNLVHFSRGLDFTGAVKFIQLQKRRSDAWNTVFGADVERVGPETFLKNFLHDKQRDFTATLTDAKVIFVELNANTHLGHSPRADEKKDSELYIDRLLFERYLHSPTMNDAYDPKSLEYIPANMNESLSSYYISSSHNTFLVGDQVKSFSSAEMYMAALQRGCKCLEIDCWNGDGQETIVFHGYTLTSAIRFADAIECIRCYLEAHPDTYPIILSLEIHCTVERQQKMARLLRDMLGERLYIPKKGDLSRDYLPSPTELRGMVVIKGKRPPDPDDDEFNTKHGNESGYDPYDEALFETGIVANSSDGSSSGVRNRSQKKEMAIHADLAKITLFHSTVLNSFEQSLALSPSHMHSINEASVSKILAKQQSNVQLWKKFNQRHITRTYPAGSRVDSSNPKPLLHWALGAQMVSLNFQTSDSSLILNDGLFLRNGGCGYVLKPDHLRGIGSSSASLPVYTGPQTMRIRIVSGSCLPKPKGKPKGEIVDPFVRVKLHDIINETNGVSEAESACDEEQLQDANVNKPKSMLREERMRSIDEETESILGTIDSKAKAFISSKMYSKTIKIPRPFNSTHTTRHVVDDGFSPLWDNNSWAEFSVHHMMAMVQFTVFDYSYYADSLIGSAAIPVASLRPGYRCVRLFDENNTRNGPFDVATILIEVEHLTCIQTELT